MHNWFELLGIEMRAAGIRLTPHLLKGVLK